MQEEPLREADQGVRQPGCVGSRADGGRYCTGEGVGGEKGVGEGWEVGMEKEGVGGREKVEGEGGGEKRGSRRSGEVGEGRGCMGIEESTGGLVRRWRGALEGCGRREGSR